jgi:hypothetical protein
LKTVARAASARSVYLLHRRVLEALLDEKLDRGGVHAVTSQFSLASRRSSRGF